MKTDRIPYRREIFYYETDQMGIVHHSNYIRWFEEARIDFLKQIQLPYDEMEKAGLLIPILDVNCKYIRAFRYGESFEVHLKITAFHGIKFNVIYEVYDPETGILHASGSSVHGFVDRNLVPVRLKREYPDIYDKIMNCVEKCD